MHVNSDEIYVWSLLIKDFTLKSGCKKYLGGHPNCLPAHVSIDGPFLLGILRFLRRIVNNKITYFLIFFFSQIIKKFPNLATKLEEFIPLEFLENESEIQGTQVKASKRKGLKLPLRQVFISTHNDQSAERTPLLPHTSTPKTPYGKKF